MRRLKYTALHRAVLDCRVAQVRILIEQCDADVNSRDLYGRTPLMLCCALDNERVAMAIARLVMAADPDLEVKDDMGRTALAHACLFGRESLVAYLAETRVIDPTEPDNDGCTPLHHAAVQGNSRIVSLLVRACTEGRSNVDCLNRLGCTPLMLACRLRRYHCALFLLLDGGASGFLKDDAHFLSALEWLRAAERQPGLLPQPLPLSPLSQQPLTALRRAETAPLGRSHQLQHQHQYQHQHQLQRPTFLTEYSNLNSAAGGVSQQQPPPVVSRLTRARTVAGIEVSLAAAAASAAARPRPVPLPFPLPPPGSSAPASRPTTVGSSSQQQRSRYTSATGDTVYVNVDELAPREARELLVERLRAQALEFPYPTGGPPSSQREAAEAAAVAAAAPQGSSGRAAPDWRDGRPTTRDLHAMRPLTRSSAVANACQLLGIYHAAMTAPKPAQAMAQPPHQQQQEDGGGDPAGGFAEAAAAYAGSDERSGDAQPPPGLRDRRTSSFGQGGGLDGVAGGKKSVKFKDVAR